MSGLSQRCQHGDPAAFGEVFDRFGRRLYGTALRLLADPEEAEDAMQETFITLLTRPAGPPPDNLGAWLHRVVINRCLDRLRRRQRRPLEALGDEPVAVVEAAAPHLRLDLERALDRLPTRARAILLLHDVEGLKHHEVAALLGISEGTSKSQLFRARGLVRGWLGSAAGDTP